ncbi:MAG: hypothetical protein ABFD76_06770 [Smithella sp.]
MNRIDEITRTDVRLAIIQERGKAIDQARKAYEQYQKEQCTDKEKLAKIDADLFFAYEQIRLHACDDTPYLLSALKTTQTALAQERREKEAAIADMKQVANGYECAKCKHGTNCEFKDFEYCCQHFEWRGLSKEGE